MDHSDENPDRSEAVERLHDQLQDSLQELISSEDWQRALAVAARFHDYSFANTGSSGRSHLARGFTPSRVAGYRAWQQLGRQVRRGERGLQILAPIIRKVTPEDEAREEEKEERRVVGYRVVHVFDQSQTDGEPLPEVRAELVEGSLPVHWEQVTKLIADAGFGFQVADSDRLGEANGITDWTQRDVVVRASLPGAQRFKTAVHELAHVRLHEPTSEERPTCRGIIEVEAESVAYMVCAALGIDSAGYSLPYVASWSGGDVAKVTATANRVIGCARTVIDQLEQSRDLEHERAERSTSGRRHREGTLEEVSRSRQAGPTRSRTGPRSGNRLLHTTAPQPRGSPSSRIPALPGHERRVARHMAARIRPGRLAGTDHRPPRGRLQRRDAPRGWCRGKVTKRPSLRPDAQPSGLPDPRPRRPAPRVRRETHRR